MAYQFTLAGSYTSDPLDGVPSLDPTIGAPLDESMVLDQKIEYTLPLTVDTPVALQFGGVTEANVIILKAVGGKVKARITSTDGSQQAIPFDSVLILTTRALPITAIDLVRTPATAIDVRIFIGQLA